MIPLRDDNPTRITPYLTWLLVAVNVLVYAVQATGGMYETRSGLAGPLAGWTLVPAELIHGVDLPINGPTLHPVWLTIFTAMFLHGGLMHLLGNMLFLIIFGNNIEEALGRAKYLAFYLICGFIAALAQVFMTPNSMIPTLGASGAIAGVLGGYFVLYPQARVNTLVFLGIFITTIQVPAWVILGFWIVSQFFSHWTQSLKTMDGDTGGVAYVAHIGGFLAGMLLIKLMGARPAPPVDPPYIDYGGYGDNPRFRRVVVPPRPR